ncbi:hypothetical protein ACU4GD_26005 [Cupriavidus basilensis]
MSDTRIGRIGALVCGENTNALARFTLLAQGENVHVSSSLRAGRPIRRESRATTLKRRSACAPARTPSKASSSISWHRASFLPKPSI